MNSVEDTIRINALYDYYKELLTEKQKDYFEAFYFENMSLSEIADNYGVSRNAVYSQLNLTVDAINKYESKLHLYENDIKREKLFNKLKELDDKRINDLVSKLEEI